MKRRQPRNLPPPPADRVVLSVVEAAGLLGIGESTIRDLVRTDKIPHTRLGRRILFRRQDLERMVTPSIPDASPPAPLPAPPPPPVQKEHQPAKARSKLGRPTKTEEVLRQVTDWDGFWLPGG